MDAEPIQKRTPCTLQSTLFSFQNQTAAYNYLIYKTLENLILGECEREIVQGVSALHLLLEPLTLSFMRTSVRNLCIVNQ